METKVVGTPPQNTPQSKFVHSNPSIEWDVVIESTPARNVFGRSFERCNQSLAGLCNVYPRVQKDRKAVDGVNAEIERLLSEASEEVRKELSVLKAEAEKAGVADKIACVKYSFHFSGKVQVKDHNAMRYLQIIAVMDELMKWLHLFKLLGLREQNSTLNAERYWTHRIEKVSYDLSNLNRRAYGAIQRVIKITDPTAPKEPEQQPALDETQV